MKNKINNLIKFLNKKGITDIKIGKYGDSVDIYYTRLDIRLLIRVYFYSKYCKYGSPDETPKYKHTYITYYNNRGTRVNKSVSESINKLRTKLNRSDFNSAVYKNILKIQSWLDPVIDKKRKTQDDLTEFASELEFYFKDKYGEVKISISGKDVKNITASFKSKKNSREHHHMIYEDGNYYLDSIQQYWFLDENIIYQGRKKIKK